MMSGNLEKIFLILFLILGINVFSLTHAEDDFSYTEVIHQECPIKGEVSLRLEGTLRNGELLGTIDNKYVSWFVEMGNIQGHYNGNFMNLKIKPAPIREFILTGWIGSYYVCWRSFGGYFYERIECR
jgi:hypothetical protein